MIRDAQLQFGDTFATTSGTTVAATNVIDLALVFTTTTNSQHEFCTTDPMLLYFQWTATPAGTSMFIDLRSATTTDVTAATFRTHWSTGVIVAANYATTGIGVTTGTTYISLPHGQFNPSLGAAAQGTGFYLRYLGVVFGSTGDNSVGRVTCGLIKAGDMGTLPAFAAPSGYAVS